VLFDPLIVYTFLLGILCEGIPYFSSRIRHTPIIPSILLQGGDDDDDNNSNIRQRRRKKKLVRRLILSILYGIQQCLGWGLMLISMTFSIELFGCVIMGIIVGKLIFPITDQPQHHHLQRDQPSLESVENGSPILNSTPTRPSTIDDATTTPPMDDGRRSSDFRRRRR
jgi:hypothetical protein